MEALVPFPILKTITASNNVSTEWFIVQKGIL